MARRFMCGTPTNLCEGSKCAMNAALGKSFQQKAHSSRPEAFRCYKRYLIKHEGYLATNDSLRELSHPERPRLILSKQSKFGQELRLGKNADGKGIRYMPKYKGQSGALI